MIFFSILVNILRKFLVLELFVQQNYLVLIYVNSFIVWRQVRILVSYSACVKDFF